MQQSEGTAVTRSGEPENHSEREVTRVLPRSRAYSNLSSFLADSPVTIPSSTNHQAEICVSEQSDEMGQNCV